MADPSAPASRRPSTATLVLGAAAILAVASGGVALYRSAGGDVAASGPHGSAVPSEPVGDVDSMIAKLEARLKQDSNDAEGWRMLGWSHFETGDFAKAAVAYRRAAELEPDKAENWSSLGEAIQVANQKPSPEARMAFQRALGLDPQDARARYFLAVQKDLSGDHNGAINDWLALLRDTPPGAPWEADLRRTIQQTADKEEIDISGRMPAPSGGSVATAAIPGPTPQDLAAASSLPPSQQSEMVRGMVDGLAARLAANPKDSTGWIRLMRARMVLGETDGATAALKSGLAAFNGDSATQGQIRRAAEELGVPSG